MLFGNNQALPWGKSWLYIEDSYNTFILIDFPGIGFPADNLTKDTENSGSFLERTIEPADMTVDAASPVRGKLNLYVTDPGQRLDGMPFADDGFIIVATKSLKVFRLT